MGARRPPWQHLKRSSFSAATWQTAENWIQDFIRKVAKLQKVWMQFQQVFDTEVRTLTGKEWALRSRMGHPGRCVWELWALRFTWTLWAGRSTLCPSLEKTAPHWEIRPIANSQSPPLQETPHEVMLVLLKIWLTETKREKTQTTNTRNENRDSTIDTKTLKGKEKNV